MTGAVRNNVLPPNLERNVRLIDVAIAEPASRHLVQDPRESRALLLDRDGVVRVLVAQVLHRRRQVTEEDL